MHFTPLTNRLATRAMSPHGFSELADSVSHSECDMLGQI